MPRTAVLSAVSGPHRVLYTAGESSYDRGEQERGTGVDAYWEVQASGADNQAAVATAGKVQPISVGKLAQSNIQIAFQVMSVSLFSRNHRLCS